MAKVKAGRLSSADMAFIRKNASKMPAEDIAEYLGRGVRAITNFIHDNRLGAEHTEAPEGAKRSQREILRALRGKIFYSELNAQFNERELRFFADQWTLIVSQFGGDILPSEELDLKEMLTFEILKSRLLVENKRAKDEEQRAKAELARQMAAPSEQRDKEIVRYSREAAVEAREIIKENLKSIKSFSEQSQKLQSSLNASRHQRTKDLDNARFDFVALLKVLQEKDAKERAGYEMEALKLARQKKEREMAGYHQFADKTLDRLVINSETVELGDEIDDKS